MRHAGSAVSGIAVLIRPAQVRSAGMPEPEPEPVPMIVMRTANSGIEFQRARKIRVNRFISHARNPSEKLYAGFCQSILGSCADTAANQHVHAGFCQKISQCPVSLPVGIDNLAARYFSVFNIVKLELLGMSEMLENHAVLIGRCDLHIHILFFRF